jgi:hypothetical protein
MIPGEEPGVVRENRAAVYASDRVQKANRKYMGEPTGRIISQPPCEKPFQRRTSIPIRTGKWEDRYLVTGAGRQGLEDKL